MDMSGICQTCPGVCATCDNSFVCKTCKPGYFLYNNMCINSCPDRTYYNGSTCVSCSSLCAKCSEAKYCTECDPLAISKSTTVFGIPKTTCVSVCEAGSFVINGVCKTCSEIGKVMENNVCVDSCSPGNYSDSGICKTCLSSGRFIYDGQCINYCPNNYLWGYNQICYPNNNILSYNNTLVQKDDINECNPNPCRNGGICTKGSTFSCTCGLKYWGSKCEQEVDRGIYFFI
jgi:hypothetical protein